jgi:mono/diheme cytochrome c family protein
MRPTPAERGVLLGFEMRHAAGQPLRLLRTVRATETGDDVTIHFMQAIPMMEGCAACHGVSVDPDTARAIRDLYPDDEAVGFAVGDLRGAFSLYKTVPAAEFAKPPAAATSRSRLDELGYRPTERPGARGSAARGADAFAQHCQSCHAPDRLARHSFGDGEPFAQEAVCRKLETHGYTGKEQDCDIVAFLHDLALHLAGRE